MTKAYSTKALPPGTILREWRLEEVLGVGGFGIVYKGRGIYFDELVAIKEYFPSAISERDEEETVVPIDSDAEEVHALGLKKFVEEAKLLWNLSTPSRHPNIVSVRSLFEIHGTAYMVMDFEDGIALSQLIKRGETFDEAKLRTLILPVATGLERAHRVGVLHRDIKPSNILITEEGRPVLIDFGSARFETEGVTSTSVTFHTPPYAAIEQYVKTYEQGPWTDIYALGVVLYRCVTGTKPAEVLERLHGEKEPALADGDWPGYSRTFLAAVDAAMTIKPADRPQSLSEWLALFDGEEVDAGGDIAAEDDDDATRIVPVADTVADIGPIETRGDGEAKAIGAAAVPDNVDDAEFVRVGDDGNSDALTDLEPFKDKAEPKADDEGKAAPAKSALDKGAAAKSSAKTKPLLLAGAGLVLIAGFGWALSDGEPEPEPDPVEEAEPIVEDIAFDDGFGPALQQLVELGTEQGVAPEAIAALRSRAERIEGLENENIAIAEDPSRASDVSFNRLRIADVTRASLNELGVGLSRFLTARTRAMVDVAPWSDPRRSGSAAGESDTLRGHAATLETENQKARQAIQRLRGAQSAEAAIPLAQRAILAAASYQDAVKAALAANPARSEPTAEPTAAETQVASPTPTPTTSPTATQTASARSIEQVSAELKLLTRQTKNEANEVIRLGRVRKPRRSASEEEQEAYRVVKSNADAARDYKNYLDRLERSMRAAATPAAAESLLAQGRQTQQYVRAIGRTSRASRAILDR